MASVESLEGQKRPDWSRASSTQPNPNVISNLISGRLWVALSRAFSPAGTFARSGARDWTDHYFRTTPPPIKQYRQNDATTPSRDQAQECAHQALLGEQGSSDSREPAHRPLPQVLVDLRNPQPGPDRPALAQAPSRRQVQQEEPHPPLRGPLKLGIFQREERCLHDGLRQPQQEAPSLLDRRPHV